jgi:hypothetical protein
MTVEYENEPVRGLPGFLPRGETMLWQGSPDWYSFARAVFHTRLVAGWFVLVALSAFVAGGTGLLGAAITVLVALLGLGILAAIAWGQARSTVYTLTDRRIVMRFGLALPKCVNLPLALIETADMKPAGPGHADVALKLHGRFPLGWLQMWPHVRPWQVGDLQPMLRCVPDAFAPVLAAALAKADPARNRPVATAAKAPAETPPMGVAA